MKISVVQKIMEVNGMKTGINHKNPFFFIGKTGVKVDEITFIGYIYSNAIHEYVLIKNHQIYTNMKKYE